MVKLTVPLEHAVHQGPAHISRQAYELYGLTEKEIGVVEGKG